MARAVGAWAVLLFEFNPGHPASRQGTLGTELHFLLRFLCPAVHANVEKAEELPGRCQEQQGDARPALKQLQVHCVLE
jgi:hypothetical protein